MLYANHARNNSTQDISAHILGRIAILINGYLVGTTKDCAYILISTETPAGRSRFDN